MIFLTIGTQLPFDRLVRVIDGIAPDLPFSVFAQIGETSYEPVNMIFERWLAPAHFDECIRKCDFVICHAGIGTILSALKFQKPIIIFPRRAALGEHRNDHQLATCNQLSKRKGIYIAYDEDVLKILAVGASLEMPDELDLIDHRKEFSDRIRKFIASVI